MTPTKQPNEHLLHGYNRMIERVKTVLDHSAKREGIAPSLAHAIAAGKDTAVTLQELSREEAERIGKFLRRDIEDAAEYLATSQGDLANWMRFDLELIEERLAEAFLSVADRTRVELSQLAEDARHADEYLTDEVTGPGSLQCTSCNNILCFQETSHIPACPVCQATLFKRLTSESDSPLDSQAA
ncbi:conserved hypothetical protein [Gammaproteobacteria bacterium]